MSITVNNATQAEVTLDTDTVDTIAILEADAALSSRPKRAKVTWVQRIVTVGGLAPARACTGGTVAVPYRAVYRFFVAA